MYLDLYGTSYTEGYSTSELSPRTTLSMSLWLCTDSLYYCLLLNFNESPRVQSAKLTPGDCSLLPKPIHLQPFIVVLRLSQFGCLTLHNVAVYYVC